jgi:hypothetical protein
VTRLNDLLRLLRLSRHWVGAQFGWVLAWIWVGVAILHLPGIQRWPQWLSDWLRVSYSSLVMIAALAVQTGMLRSLIRNDARRVRPIWGALALLLWGMSCLIVASIPDYYLHNQIWQWLLAWVVAPAIFFPFAGASAVWGWRLPWRRVLRLVCAWRWWLGVLLVGAIEKLAELRFDRLSTHAYVWDVDLPTGLKMGAVDILETGVWILLLVWLAALLDPAD